ncbi:hypothetical protein BSKO_04304 [Bryopsis sp. KO-2023]|nr:hypothetical protein BSKO_04304 [Bryopsis sp. KO-2023]
MDDAEEDWDVATGIQDEAVASFHLDASGLSVAKVGNELKEQVRRKAHREAFWDSMEWQLASQAEGAGDQLLNMLAEIERDSAKVQPKNGRSRTGLSEIRACSPSFWICVRCAGGHRH